MTERYLVMPRGINVGARNRVPMAERRSKLAGEGFSDVLGVVATARNWNTLSKIVVKF